MTASTSALDGAFAIVTGASSGIGACYARELAARGCVLGLVARREDRLRALAAELASHGRSHHVFAADLSDPAAPRRLFEQATAVAPVQVLVNNAGLGAYGHVVETDLDRQLRSVDVNVRALTELSQRFGRHMLEHGRPSYISNVASLASFQSAPGYAVYSGSKFYVRIFSETMAHELQDTQVRVSCLCPGGTYTEFMESAGTQITKKGERVMMSAEAVAKIGVEGMLAGRRVVVPGAMNRVAAFLPRFFPNKLGLSVAGRTLERSMTKRS